MPSYDGARCGREPGGGAGVAGQPDQPALPEQTDDAGLAASRTLPAQRPQPVEQGTTDRPARADMRQAELRPGDSVGEQLKARLWRLPPGHPSSPYDGDGSLRPPVPDWRELCRALPGDGPDGDGALTTADEPASPGKPEASTAGSVRPQIIENDQRAQPESTDRDSESVLEVDQSWLDAVPVLRELWQKHEEKWPESERPPVDRSDDEPGSWRGDSGHYLNAEENLVSEHAKTRIEEVEDKSTPVLLAIKDEIPGANMAGLEFKLKGIDRFKEKIAEETRSKPERSIGEIAERMPDALRYTYEIADKRYTEGYWHGRAALLQQGNELLMSRNSWNNPEYKGINTRWLSPQGQVFEVQFHTPESYEAKQLTHRAYERLRSRSTDATERPALERYQREVSANIPIPHGAGEIPDYRREGY